jgi:hypothetical protein
MPINFPDSPTNGQEITLGDGKLVYNSTKGIWNHFSTAAAAESSGGGASVVATHDLLPSSPSAGDMALVSSVNKMYVYFLSGWWLMSSLQNASPSGITGNAAIYDLATDGTPTTVTLSSSDPEGFPISWTHSVISGSLGGTTVTNVDNVFTITPSTDAADAGTFTLRFAASDGQGGESGSQSNFTLDFVFIVANSRYTTLLATAVDTSDNNNITDTSTNNHSITVNGDAHAGTFSPYRSGGYSTYFDGTGDYLRTPTINLSGDFTIQFFVNLNAITTDVGIFSFGTLTSTNSILELYNNTSGQFRLYSSSGGELGASSAAEADKWYHVAITRSGNTFKAYLDGVEFADDTTARTINSAITIGGYVNTSYLMNGHIRDFRITTNVEYPSNNFTPPSEPLTAITGTVLLTCHLPYIADGSTNDHSITVNNDVSTKPFSPYNYNEYSATNNGGSVYFDGSGDSLNTTTTQIIPSSSFTVTAWVYLNDTTDGAVWGQGTAGHSGRTGITIDNNNWFAQIGSANLGTSTSVSTNRWYYTDLQWDGSTLKFFVDGSSLGSVSNSNSPTNSAFYIGDLGSAWSTGYPLNGYVSDLKVVSGTPSGSSTVPTSPLSSSGAELHIKGTDASIIDKSQSANLKLVANTTGSTTQVKFAGTKSMYFDGSWDHISIPADDSIFSKDYTIEFWMYPTQDTNLVMPLSKGVGLQFYHQSGNIAAAMSASNSGSYFYNGNFGSITTNAWSHISLVRDSSANTYKFYINGTLEDTLSSSSNIDAGSANWIIGAYSTAGTYGFEGYIQDVRITKGLTRYTANFTPPTAPLEG